MAFAFRASAPLLRQLVPATRAGLDTPQAFLQSIGRKMDTKVSPESWDELFKLESEKLKADGVDVRDRRYLLWSLEKFRAGEDPKSFAHEARGKKKIRGHGPSVQGGKRIRSRRKQ
ncbi:unnamed protein product [Peniophora sp. CBMAI 1063]|nr:unnamed protein product [Peniophora sp. CBMAI 1063]